MYSSSSLGPSLLGPTDDSVGTMASSASEQILKWARFLLGWPEAISTTYDLGVSAACETWPGA